VESTDNQSYAAPQVIDYGDLVQLTAAASHGAYTDAAFSSHTPVADLTFSGV
jgi:hypothetical protein